ncbi:24.1 kDa heat shock protein, mitochondrial-like [Hevea brasiliensis]|uniref:24.1 kDa heat shock protein, mitochondrial-like n=1 Tax=Hevea brasiliensis TaxID=3981 RepID=UPI0025E4FB0D|nr:24.1 kDa heat shock protein, mitochondrial-like [Hevea brasiliensis]
MASAVPLTKPFSYRTKRISTHDPDMGPQLPIPIPVATGTYKLVYLDSLLGGGLKFLPDVKEDEDALYMKMNMPGVGKEGVKLWMDMECLHIKGEESKEDAEDEYDFKEEKKPKKYFYECQMAPELYQTDKIKALMKNGVLKIVVPKVNTQEEEKEGVTRIKVN